MKKYEFDATLKSFENPKNGRDYYLTLTIENRKLALAIIDEIGKLAKVTIQVVETKHAEVR